MLNGLVLALMESAAAQPCPALQERVQAAWDSFEVAELDSAAALITEAASELSCHTEIVQAEDLLALYRLQALLALTAEDREAMEAATRRAVAVQHVDGSPPEKFGPELSELYGVWAERAASELIDVSVDGAGGVWVDGRAAPVTVARGVHLLQIELPDAVASQVVELLADHTVATGGRVAPVLPDPSVLAATPPRARWLDRRRPAAVWLPAIATGAASGLALATGVRSERSFGGSAYDGAVFGDCAYGASCYGDARAAAIRADARRIDIAYGVGYGLAAVTAGLFSVTVTGLRARN